MRMCVSMCVCLRMVQRMAADQICTWRSRDDMASTSSVAIAPMHEWFDATWSGDQPKVVSACREPMRTRNLLPRTASDFIERRLPRGARRPPLAS